ncbi:hypothetical protein SD960_00810 [Flavobacterium sp. MMLR14_040]|uniref:hypothetical protein n=1 Tax=Flavobacterium sp. MMLR14_040 TaxID=3093843 RepID=UPI00298FB8CC|nr:hypothetical protein [Flavobacterium sp. MMLR14_040]MDW8848613.1 hypothetical protein [Flavobacterium sp. MMLR14_040]
MKKWRQLTPFDCGDLYRINFYIFYGRFEEIGVIDVDNVFHWRYKFVLNVLLGIDLSFFEKNDIRSTSFMIFTRVTI